MRSLKKSGLLALALLLLVLASSCNGPPLDSKGEFTESEFIGNFHGVSVYSVITPPGNQIYLGIIENDESPVIDGVAKPTAVTSYGNKGAVIPTIVINGVKMTKEDALKSLVNEEYPKGDR
jgi:hypothetical protein